MLNTITILLTDFNIASLTLLEFEPNSDNEQTGFVARQNDKYHYETGVTLRQSKRWVFLHNALKDKTVEPTKYLDIQLGPVILSVKASPLSYEFSCTPSTGAQESLGTALTKDLSVEEISFDNGICFTGVYFGRYTIDNGKKCPSPKKTFDTNQVMEKLEPLID